MSQQALELERARLMDLLRGYMTHVPPKVINGSFNLAVDFKKSVAEAGRVHAKRNVSPSELTSAINNLNRYWE